MRRAKVEDYWRHAYKRPYQTRIGQVQFQDVIGIGTGEISFTGGITAICGGNGVGKTTLLDVIQSSITDMEQELSPSSKRRLTTAIINTSVTVGDKTQNVRSTFAIKERTYEQEAVQIGIRALDPSIQSIHLIRRFSEMRNLSELLEALSPRLYSDVELKTISYCVGKDYESCQVFEIEEFEDEAPFPYLFVRSAGVEYGSESMGFGEMSLHLMLWELNRLTRESVLLIEEPETYISPRSQQALMNVLARTAVEKSIWIILTTHSAGIISRVPLDHVRLLVREGNRVRIIASPTKSQLDAVFSVPQQYSTILLVEDRAAAEFLRALVSDIEPELLRSCEIRQVGSAQEVQSLLRTFPNGDPWLHLVGVLDGDARTDNLDCPWPGMYLPGSLPPERLLRAAINLTPEILAALLNRPVNDVAVALASLEGSDHHEWFEELSGRIQVSYSELMRCLAKIWLSDPRNQALGQRFVEDLKANLTKEYGHCSS
jgi:predicted ATPase